jgi:hypothetical protein
MFEHILLLFGSNYVLSGRKDKALNAQHQALISYHDAHQVNK